MNTNIYNAQRMHSRGSIFAEWIHIYFIYKYEFILYVFLQPALCSLKCLSQSFLCYWILFLNIVLIVLLLWDTNCSLTRLSSEPGTGSLPLSMRLILWCWWNLNMFKISYLDVILISLLIQSVTGVSAVLSICNFPISTSRYRPSLPR